MKYEEAINAIEQFAKDIKKDKSFSKATKEGAVSSGKVAAVAGGTAVAATTATIAAGAVLLSPIALALGALGVAGLAKFKKTDEYKLLSTNLTKTCSYLKEGQGKEALACLKEVYDKSKEKSIRAVISQLEQLIKKDE